MREKYAAYVGLDWADSSHQISMRAADDEEIERLQIVQKPEAIQEWIWGLRRRFPNSKIAIAVEQKRGAVIYSLMKYENLVIFPLNTTTVKNYRKALRASGAKDDRSDADFQLEFLEKHIGQLRKWEPENVRTRKLRFLVEWRRKMVDQATAVSNQITALLKESYPVGLEMIGSPMTIMSCNFLKKWPNLTSLKRTKREVIERFFYKHNCRNKPNISKRLAFLSVSQPLIEEKEMIATYSFMLHALVDQLRTILVSIKRFDTRIQQVFETHPDNEIYKSFSGAGPVIAPRLAVVMGEDRKRFENARVLQNLTGVAPITTQSGKSKTVHFRLAAPKFQRQTLIEFARVSIRFCSWAKMDYDVYRKRGATHQAAIRRIAYKWIRVIFRCWKDRVPYNETIFLAARSKHPTLPA